MNEALFMDLALSNEVNREILNRLPSLGLPDAWLVSGCLFQTIWNLRTDRDPNYGIKDYDIFYFDPDTSWEAEDREIKRVEAAFADIDAEVELKNQARVHLWYRQKFGTTYPQLARSTEGIENFLAPCCMVGVSVSEEGRDVYAPKGFHDLEQMIVRPNLTGNFTKEAYDLKSARWKTAWPELMVISV